VVDDFNVPKCLNVTFVSKRPTLADIQFIVGKHGAKMLTGTHYLGKTSRSISANVTFEKPQVINHPGTRYDKVEYKIKGSVYHLYNSDANLCNGCDLREKGVQCVDVFSNYSIYRNCTNKVFKLVR
jgi:hypothetical protein